MSKELNYLLSLLKGAAVLKGGALRAAMGKIVEDFTEYIWNEVAKEFPTLDSLMIRGEKSPITIFGSFKESVDKHCYINGKLVLAVECKTYLDKCYLQRADSDFSLLKENNNFISVIVSLQDSVAQDTLSYFMTRKNINKVFFLSNIKRCSMPDKHISRNPEWILEEKITELVNFIKQIYEEENKNATTTRCKRC